MEYNEKIELKKELGFMRDRNGKLIDKTKKSKL